MPPDLKGDNATAETHVAGMRVMQGFWRITTYTANLASTFRSDPLLNTMSTSEYSPVSTVVLATLQSDSITKPLSGNAISSAAEQKEKPASYSPTWRWSPPAPSRAARAQRSTLRATAPTVRRRRLPWEDLPMAATPPARHQRRRRLDSMIVFIMFVLFLFCDCALGCGVIRSCFKH